MYLVPNLRKKKQQPINYQHTLKNVIFFYTFPKSIKLLKLHTTGYEILSIVESLSVLSKRFFNIERHSINTILFNWKSVIRFPLFY